jgi:hypothetical protein
MSKYPPMPPANRSPKDPPQGPGSASEIPARDRRKPGEPPNYLREQGDAFVYDEKDGHLVPNLVNIKLFGVVTSYGSAQSVVRGLAGDAGRTVLMRGLRAMCARDASSFYLAYYGMDSSTLETRQAFLRKVQAEVATVSEPGPRR